MSVTATATSTVTATSTSTVSANRVVEARRAIADLKLALAAPQESTQKVAFVEGERRETEENNEWSEDLGSRDGGSGEKRGSDFAARVGTRLSTLVPVRALAWPLLLSGVALGTGWQLHEFHHHYGDTVARAAPVGSASAVGASRASYCFVQLPQTATPAENPGQAQTNTMNDVVGTEFSFLRQTAAAAPVTLAVALPVLALEPSPKSDPVRKVTVKRRAPQKRIAVRNVPEKEEASMPRAADFDDVAPLLE